MFPTRSASAALDGRVVKKTGLETTLRFLSGDLPINPFALLGPYGSV